MNTNPPLISRRGALPSMLAMGMCSLTARAESRQFSSILDAGGGAAQSVVYSAQISFGSLSPGTSERSSTFYRERPGYAGQLSEPIGIRVALPAISLPEGQSFASELRRNEDDGTETRLATTEAVWSTSHPDLLALDSAGIATAGSVYQATNVFVQAVSIGFTNQQHLLILDVNPDNFGLYTGDGLPDAWQAGYFGVENPLALPNVDSDLDGLNNAEEYVAGTRPNNAGSRLLVSMRLGQAETLIDLQPRLPDRSYRLWYTPALDGRPWTELISPPHTDSGLVRTYADPELSLPTKFYRISVTYP